jgi:hypothetical protein
VSSGDDARWDYFKPAAPTSVIATESNAQAVVSWTAPAVVVPPLTDYSVQFSTNGGSTWTTFTDGVSTATSATITGLTNGTAHVFRVAGINGIGTGAYSTASAAVTPTAVVPDPLFANVALLLPMDGTGSTFADSSPTPKTVTAYGDATQSTAQSKWGGKSLALDGSGDYVSVSSIELSGDFVFETWLRWNGAIARSFSAIVLGSSANTQFFLTTKSDRTGLRFGLTGVAEYAAGSYTWVPDTWYYVALVRSSSAIRLYVDGINVTDGSPTTSNTFSGELRLAGSEQAAFDSNMYLDDVRLTVGSDRGYAGATIPVPSAAFPSSGPMSAPTSLVATGGNAQIALAWTAPSYNGGSAITGYTVEYTPSGGSAQTVSTGSTSTSYTLTGLTNGTAYTVRVAGVSASGTGAYSTSVSGTPIAVSAPTAVRNLRVTSTEFCGYALNEWDAPLSDGGGPISGYRVVLSGDLVTSSNTTQAASTRTRVVDSGGSPSPYSITVYAINAAGESAAATLNSRTGDCS